MTPFVQTLYKDYGNKLDAIRTYLEKLNARTDQVKSSSLTCVGALIEKYNAIVDFNKNMPERIPSTSFSVEDEAPVVDADQIDVDKLDSNIALASKDINYQFEKATEELQGLVQLYQDLQNLLNTIWDTWAEQIQQAEKT